MIIAKNENKINFLLVAVIYQFFFNVQIILNINHFG